MAEVNQFQRQGYSWSGYERNCCFLNRDGKAFSDTSAVSGFDFLDDARAVALTDWDDDGDLDVWVTNRTGPRVRFLSNANASQHHWIKIRLEGTQCNRDAIGARVLLSFDSAKGDLSKTLRAGSGYLAQSSKWMHFGLGQHAENVSLTVRWPDGQTQRIPDVAVDQRYFLRQAAGLQIVPARAAVKLKPQPLDAETDDAAVRSFMPVPVPLPQLSYDAADGPCPVTSGESAVLLTLWSANCTTCLTELNDWSHQRDRFGEANVEVLALNVDSLLEGPGDEAADTNSLRERASALFQKMGLPFQGGFATRDLLNRIEALQLHLFDNSRPLLLPCSLLIDKHGALAAFYRGRMPLEQIANDGRTLVSGSTERISYALPFPGRWRAQLGSPNVRAIGNAFARAGYPNDVLDIYRSALRGEPGNVALRDQYADQLRGRGHLHAALEERRQIAELRPDDVRNWLQQSVIQQELGDVPSAIDSLGHVTELEPAHPAANLRLGECYLLLARHEQAARCLQRALTAEPQNTGALINLSLAKQGLGDFASAAELLQRTLLADPRSLEAKNNLAWLLATAPDRSVRDPRQAVRLALEAAEAVQYGDANILDTLSTAYAADGNTSLAIQWLEKCIALSPTSRQNELQARLQTLRRQFSP